MRDKILDGLFAEGGLLRVRAILAETLVIGGLILLGLQVIESEIAIALIFSGAGTYGIQRAGK